jgi:[lysine-biosynthesis-protein LysW]---L-2-aminoadipate ligase
LNIGILYSVVRMEEKMIFKELENRKVPCSRINERELVLDVDEKRNEYGLILDRSLNYFGSLLTLGVLNSRGTNTINSFETAQMCGNKLFTSAALAKNKVVQPKTMIAVSPDGAMSAIEKIGYPCVIKPFIGSWGRMVSKINDRDSAEALIEHKKNLGNFLHHSFYVQEYIEKSGRDIRSFVIGEETVAAIYRESEHWITNTARGGKAVNCPVTPALNEISLKAAKAVKGEVVAIDIFETPRGFLVNEINHVMEFRNSVSTTGVNIPKKIVEYALETVRN